MHADQLEALKAMNRQVATLAGVALQGIDQLTWMIAVWAVQTGRYEDALDMSRNRGVDLTQDALEEIEILARRCWGLNDDRASRPNCALCQRTLPERMETLCKCFRRVQAGVHISPFTTERIAELKVSFPNDWEDLPMETIICKRCGDPEEIKASKVDASLRRGKAWIPQKQPYCQRCYQEHNDHVRSTSQPPPQYRSSTPPAKRRSNRPVVPKHTDIQAIQQLVAQTLSPAGDS